MSFTATFLKRASEDVNEPATFRGLPLIIETPKGGVREGDYPDGTHWSKTMLADYGYIQDTTGSGDGEPVDVYVGDDKTSDWAFAVEQLDDKGEFDEYKVMLGFPDLQSAEKCYTDMWGTDNLGDISEIPLHQLFDGVEQNKTAGEIPSVVQEFLNSYDFEFYERVAEEVQEFLEDLCRAAGVRALVTSRAKRVKSLRNKLLMRHNKARYEDLMSIKKDIKDLAGVRVALYFPQDKEKMDQIILNNFEQAREPKMFPRDAAPEDGQVYTATHYTVWWEETVVEIQVASVFMQAFQEVSHDLQYKPQLGDLSQAEIQILDLLGGLAGAGEASVDELQGEIERRTGTPLRHDVKAALKTKLAAAAYNFGMYAEERVLYPEEKPFKTEMPYRKEIVASRLDKLKARTGVTDEKLDKLMTGLCVPPEMITKTI